MLPTKKCLLIILTLGLTLGSTQSIADIKINRSLTPSSRLQKKETHTIMLATITKAYLAKNWQKKALLFDKKIAKKIGPEQYEQLCKNSVCLTKENKMILAFPLSSINAPINTLSDTITSQVHQQFPEFSVTLLWFNKRGQTWEMYYPEKNESLPEAPYLWMLNNKELSLKNLSIKQSNSILEFLNYPF